MDVEGSSHLPDTQEMASPSSTVQQAESSENSSLYLNMAIQTLSLEGKLSVFKHLQCRHIVDPMLSSAENETNET